MLEIIDVRKAYKSALVLKISCLELEKGIFWLRGLNGSGKTTLLGMIAGLLPFQGDIVLDKISQKRQPMLYRRKVSWAAAEPLYPAFVKGQDLVLFYKQIRKASSTQIDQLIRFFGLGSYLSNPLGSYSSGMTKRLSLMLAFIGEADLIVLDEPLATLDAEMTSILPNLIEQYCNEGNVSFIFSSHHSLVNDTLIIKERLLVSGSTVQIEADL